MGDPRRRTDGTKRRDGFEEHLLPSKAVVDHDEQRSQRNRCGAQHHHGQGGSLIGCRNRSVPDHHLVLAAQFSGDGGQDDPDGADLILVVPAEPPPMNINK